MPYFLFTFHCKWCRNSLRGLPRQTALRDRASGAPGQARARAFAASGARSVVSSPRDCLVRSPLEPGTAREQGSFCLRMLTYVAQDLGDCWWMTRSSYPVESFAATPGLGPGVAHAALYSLDLVGVCPNQGNSVLFHPCYCWGKSTGVFFGAVFCVACLNVAGKDTRMARTEPLGSWRMPARGPERVHSH